MRIVALEAVPITHFDHRGQPLNYLFVRLQTDEGIIGYGEACDSYGCNFPLSVKAIIEEALRPLLLGEDLSSVEQLAFKMRGWTRRRLGDQGAIIHAISSVEIALWDALGKAASRSISHLLGRVRDDITVYASGTFMEEGPADWHLRLFEPCLQQGVRAVKVRVGLDFRRDLATLRTLRSMLDDDIQLMVDGSEHFSVPTALEIARALADLGVLFFEEPVPQCAREGIARLVKASPVPIAYGEHLFTIHDFEDCLIHRRADVVQPDAALCGGISEAKSVATLAESFGAGVILHSAAGPMALAANLHLSAVAPNIQMLEYSFTLDPLWREMVGESALSPSALRAGKLPVPSGPGLGLAVDEEVWKKYPYQARGPEGRMPTWSLGHV